MKSPTKICQLSQVLANYPPGPFRDTYPDIPILKLVILDVDSYFLSTVSILVMCVKLSRFDDCLSVNVNVIKI